MMSKHRRKWPGCFYAVNRVVVKAAHVMLLGRHCFFSCISQWLPAVDPRLTDVAGSVCSWVTCTLCSLSVGSEGVPYRGARELRLQEYLGHTAACVLTSHVTVLTSHHNGKFGVVRGFTELPLSVSSSLSKISCAYRFIRKLFLYFVGKVLWNWNVLFGAEISSISSSWCLHRVSSFFVEGRERYVCSSG